MSRLELHWFTRWDRTNESGWSWPKHLMPPRAWATWAQCWTFSLRCMAYTTTLAHVVRLNPLQNGSSASRFAPATRHSLQLLIGLGPTLCIMEANSARLCPILNVCLTLTLRLHINGIRSGPATTCAWRAERRWRGCSGCGALWIRV